MSEKKQKKVLGRGLDALLGDTDNSDLSFKKTNTIQKDFTIKGKLKS